MLIGFSENRTNRFLEKFRAFRAFVQHIFSDFGCTIDADRDNIFKSGILEYYRYLMNNYKIIKCIPKVPVKRIKACA